jgi:hypothetical protein
MWCAHLPSAVLSSAHCCPDRQSPGSQHPSQRLADAWLKPALCEGDWVACRALSDSPSCPTLCSVIMFGCAYLSGALRSVVGMFGCLSVWRGGGCGGLCVSVQEAPLICRQRVCACVVC